MSKKKPPIFEKLEKLSRLREKARLGGGQKVFTFKEFRDRGVLDFGGFFVALVLQRLEDGLNQIQFLEFDTGIPFW